VLLLTAAVVPAQVADETADVADIYGTRGDFAVGVCKFLHINETEEVPALIELKRLEIVPDEWTVAELLTYGDLDDFLSLVGLPEYQPRPSIHDKPATRDDVAAIMRKYATRLRDYYSKRVGHALSVSHIMDEGVDRAVSPIYPH
jgi:hypothetical protein